jgi:glycosyltransferase involved in cell wall biosynthesis
MTDDHAPGVSTAVIVAPSPVPLRLGGAERHWDTMRRSLEAAGVATDVVKLPVREHTLVDLLEGYEAFSCLDLSHADLVVSGKYPAWMVQHANHVVWMLHPLRGLYDTYNAAAHEADDPPVGPHLEAVEAALDAGIGFTTALSLIDKVRDAADHLDPAATEPGGVLALPGPLARRVVHFLDRWALDQRRVRRHMAISQIVARRPDYMPLGVSPEVVIPPSCLPEPPVSEVPAGKGGDASEYLAVGRLDRPKRMDLTIAGFSRFDAPDARLTIVGDGPDRERLERAAAGDPRIRFAGRVSDEELAAAYRRCRAVLVTPVAEDFGYVTIEALQAARPVVTTSDSGGPAELVTDRTDAIVVRPDPAAIAGALTELHSDDQLAQRLATAGRTTAAAHSWPKVAQQLLAVPPSRPLARGRRGRIAALSTYPVAGWPGGGPERARKLLGSLAADGWEVELVAISPDGTSSTTVIAEGFTEVCAPLSRRHGDAERKLRRLTANLSVSDIVASVLWPASAELVQAARNALDSADVVVAVQPYLAPMALELAPGIPLVLDDHNHERALKSQMLPDDEAGRWMLDRVTDAEGAAAMNAAVIVTTTGSDARALEDDHGLAKGSVLVVPNGVDTSAVRVATNTERAQARARVLSSVSSTVEPAIIAVFVGSAHRPNVDAARELLTIAPQVPEVLFLLAGEHSDQIYPHDCPPNVLRLGAVTDARLDQLLAAADVAVNPMRSGGGSNLKVLGYFAAGVPVLSTPMGVRGIDEPERVATVVRIDRFADALRSFIADSTSDTGRDKLSHRTEAARALVETSYDWRVVSKRFADRLASVASDRRTDSASSTESMEHTK